MNWLARMLVKWPWLVSFLVNLSLRTPYLHIIDADGEVYMQRYWLIKPRKWLPFSARIHIIRRPDHDRALHDHPFNYRTFILQGWYLEEDVFGKLHLREAGSTVAAQAQTFHRIFAVPTGGVTTLFVMGRRINYWGFLVGSRKVGWAEYLGVRASK